MVFAQIQPLIRLVSAYHFQSGLAICPFLLLHQERPIRTAQQAGCTGNHLKAIPCRLFPGVVDDQDADAILVSKLFQLADYLIVAGIAVTVAYRFPDFLQGIHDNQLGITVFPDKLFQLFIQATADHLSVGGEVEGACPLHPEHTEHPALQTALVIFQSQIEDRSLVDFLFPQVLPGTDMVGNLCHQEGLSDFGRSGKDVRSRVEQVLNHRGLALEHIVHQLVQGHSVQIGRVAHAEHFPVKFLQISFGGIAFFVWVWYSGLGICRD